MAYENRSDPCGCWCVWYSKEGDGRKHEKSIREGNCDRDSDQGICMLESARILRRVVTDAAGARLIVPGWWLMQKKTPTNKHCDKRDNNNNNNNNNNDNNNNNNNNKFVQRKFHSMFKCSSQ